MKIVVGGQLIKNEIANYVKQLKPEYKIEIMSDIDAANAVKKGMADLYLGACETGGGGALALAIAFLGLSKTATVATMASKKSETEIKKLIQDGVVAFGFVETEYKYSVETILKNWK